MKLQQMEERKILLESVILKGEFRLNKARRFAFIFGLSGTLTFLAASLFFIELHIETALSLSVLAMLCSAYFMFSREIGFQPVHSLPLLLSILGNIHVLIRMGEPVSESAHATFFGAVLITAIVLAMSFYVYWGLKRLRIMSEELNVSRQDLVLIKEQMLDLQRDLAAIRFKNRLEGVVTAQNEQKEMK